MSWRESYVAQIAASYLVPGEEILAYMSGSRGIFGDMDEGLLAVTQQRIIWAKRNLFSGPEPESYPIKVGVNATFEPGKICPTLKLFGAGNWNTYLFVAGDGASTAQTINNLVEALRSPPPKRQAELRAQEAVQRRPDHIAQAQPTRTRQPDKSQTSRADSADAVLDQIERLGKLHQSGILTDEEFTQKKKDLMSRL